MSLVIRLATKLFMKLFKKTPLFKKLKTAFTLYMLGVLTAVISGLAVAGLAVYAAAQVKRSKIKRVNSLFEEGNFTPEEIRDAVEKVAVLDEALVPQDSLIREYIPGGIYEDIY